MIYSIEFYNSSVQVEITKWPAGINASFTRIAEQIEESGPNLGLPYTRPFGDGLFEIRAKGAEGYRAGVFLHFSGPTYRDPARLHQEDPTDSEQGVEDCTKETKGGATWLRKPKTVTNR